MGTTDWWGADLLGSGDGSAVWARGRGEVTLGVLREEVARTAALLAVQGVRARSTVLVQGTTSFTQLWAVFALWSLGAQVVLVEAGLRRQAVAQALRGLRPQFRLSFGREPHLSREFRDQCGVLVRHDRSGRPAATDHCLVQLSSGTIGQVRAVGRTGASLVTELARVAAVPGLPERGDRVLLLEPPTRSFALIGGVLHALSVGATVQFPPHPAAARVAALLAESDVVLGDPQHFAALAAVPGARTGRPRVAVSGGDVLPDTVAALFAERHGVRVGQAYGTTETGLVAADPLGVHAPAVGPPVPGLGTRVVDGALWVKLPESPHLDVDRRDADGWFATQDLVRQDVRSGVIRLRGRVDPAAAVSPDVDLFAIERVLHDHSEVREAVVVGADVVEAHVAGSPALDPQDLLAWCRGRLGPAQRIRLHVLPALPRTTNGKAVRHRGLLHAARVAAAASP
jgi:3-hydroxy-4-methylanthranilate adenylyltransferase